MIQHVLAPIALMGSLLGGWACMHIFLEGHGASRMMRVMLRIGAGFGTLFLMLLAASIIVNYVLLSGLVELE